MKVENFMILPKFLVYGPILHYHLNKRNKLGVHSPTVSKYHHEMAERYFYKVFGYLPDKK